MKTLFFLFIISILASSCAHENRASSELSHTDSLLSRAEADELFAIQAAAELKIKNVDLRYSNDSLIKEIYKYEKMALSGLLDHSELMSLQGKIRRIEAKVKALIEKDKALSLRNEQLVDSASQVTHKLKAEQEHLQAIVYEKMRIQRKSDSLSKLLNHPFFSKMSVTPVDFNWRGKPIECHDAKKIKRVEIRYVVNPNPDDKVKEHKIRASVLKAFGWPGSYRDETYRGETNFEKIETIECDVFIPGDYLIKITIDGAITFSETMTLK